MARGRMVSTTISTDKRLNALSLDAALVYLMAIPQLDRDGLIHGDPVLLWAKVCPRRQDLMPQMQRIINEWVAQELVSVYQDRDELVAYFVGFQKNQAMTHYDREAPSIFATPPGYVRTAKGLIPDEVKHDNKPTADELRTNSGLTPDEVPTNVNESKVKESKSIVVVADPPADVAAVFSCWQDNMPGTMTQIVSDDLADLVTTYGPNEVIHGISEAVRANVRNLRYVAGVCAKRQNGTPKPSANGNGKSNGKVTNLDRTNQAFTQLEEMLAKESAA